MPIGRVYFFTWSTYGSHLPGDPRGSRNRKSEYIPPCPALQRAARRAMKAGAVFLSPRERVLIHDRILARAARAGWTVDALNVRGNHVHIVVYVPSGESQSGVARRLKEAGTRALREANLRAKDDPIWTKMFAGSTVADIRAWNEIVEYVLEGQGENYYMHGTEIGRGRERVIEENPQELYGGEARKSERAAFFLQNALEERERQERETRRINSPETSAERARIAEEWKRQRRR